MTKVRVADETEMSMGLCNSIITHDYVLHCLIQRRTSNSHYRDIMLYGVEESETLTITCGTPVDSGSFLAFQHNNFNEPEYLYEGYEEFTIHLYSSNAKTINDIQLFCTKNHQSQQLPLTQHALRSIFYVLITRQQELDPV